MEQALRAENVGTDFKETAMDFEHDSGAATAPAFEKEAPTSLTTVQEPDTPTYPDLNSLLAALEHERIATLAYFYWQQRGCPEGSPGDDWVRAEQHIRETR
jgi:hypothetical protein